MKKNINQYISGYVDGEGCFNVSFSKRDKFTLGWETKPSFSVSQGKSSKDLIQKYASTKSCYRNSFYLHIQISFLNIFLNLRLHLKEE